MKPIGVNLIANPHIKVKMTNKFNKIPEIDVQTWTIAAILTFCVSGTAIRAFLGRVFSVSRDSSWVNEVINTIEKIAVERI